MPRTDRTYEATPCVPFLLIYRILEPIGVDNRVILCNSRLPSFSLSQSQIRICPTVRDSTASRRSGGRRRPGCRSGGVAEPPEQESVGGPASSERRPGGSERASPGTAPRRPFL